MIDLISFTLCEGFRKARHDANLRQLVFLPDPYFAFGYIAITACSSVHGTVLLRSDWWGPCLRDWHAQLRLPPKICIFSVLWMHVCKFPFYWGAYVPRHPWKPLNEQNSQNSDYENEDEMSGPFHPGSFPSIGLSARKVFLATACCCPAGWYIYLPVFQRLEQAWVLQWAGMWYSRKLNMCKGVLPMHVSVI